MEGKIKIIKNLALYLLGVALFIGGYKAHSEFTGDSHNTSIESDEAENSSGSL